MQCTLVNFYNSAPEEGSEARIVGLNLGAGFNRENHRALIYELTLLGKGGSFINILEFLLGRTQKSMS